MPDDGAPPAPTITPRQQRALQALVTGATDASAAEAANVARETVNRWRRGDPDFIAALNLARADLNQEFRDGVRALLPDALVALQDGLQSPAIGIRLRVAETLIRALQTLGEPAGRTNPEVIRLEWDTERAAVQLEKRFGIL